MIPSPDFYPTSYLRCAAPIQAHRSVPLADLSDKAPPGRVGLEGYENPASHELGYTPYFVLSGPAISLSCTQPKPYLKLLSLGKDAGMEETADDLATLALDILMAQGEKGGNGPNLFSHPGGHTDVGAH